MDRAALEEECRGGAEVVAEAEACGDDSSPFVSAVVSPWFGLSDRVLAAVKWQLGILHAHACQPFWHVACCFQI